MYYSFDSPIGTIGIESKDESITQIIFGKMGVRKDPDVLESECQKQILAYFNKELKAFDLPLNPGGTIFQFRVWEELKRIPYGKTISYNDLAISMGNINLIRAVGQANAKNPLPILIPCHRVIGIKGSLIGYSGGLERKRFLLNLEGGLMQLNLF